jgi:clan AA aspartic protease
MKRETPMSSTIESREQTEMGKVVVTARVTNALDEVNAKNGSIALDDVRSEEVEFLVDTGATFASLHRSTIEALGLEEFTTKQVRTSNGVVTRRTYGPVRIVIEDRDAALDVMEVPDDIPPLLGVIPLEIMDLVVNPKAQRLEGNPDHGGEYILDQI